MGGPTVARAILANDPGVTTLVDPAWIVADDVLPQGTQLPAILCKMIDANDLNMPSQGDTVFVRERVQIEIHANNAKERKAVKDAVRTAAFDNRFPTAAGLSNVTVHTDGEGPNMIEAGTMVRVGIQDLMVTYSKER